MTVKFRSTAALVGAWAWMIFAAANFVDLAIRGRDSASLIAAFALLVGCGLAYVLGIRPHVTADDQGVRVVNPFTTADLPWPAVSKIDSAESLRVHHTAGVTRAWALPDSPRARARAERHSARETAHLPEEVAKHVAGRTPTDFAVERLTELRTAHRPADAPAAEPKTAWSLPALLALAVPILGLIISIVAAKV